MEYTIKPCTQPFVWSLRSNWEIPNGTYYDTNNGSVFYLTDEPYVSYIGRIPIERKQNVPSN